MRDLSQRIAAANAEWHDMMDAARSYAEGRTPMNGALLLMGLSRFLNELMGDGDVTTRAVQHIEQLMRAEFPAQTGRLL